MTPDHLTTLDTAEAESAEKAKAGSSSLFGCGQCDDSYGKYMMCFGDGYFCSMECRDAWHDMHPEADHGARSIQCSGKGEGGESKVGVGVRGQSIQRMFGPCPWGANIYI